MFQPILTFIVGVAAVLISFIHWKIAHAKLRLDLYDRRYRIYNATRQFLTVIEAKSSFEDKDLLEFVVATQSVEFLFGSEVADFLQDIGKRAVSMRGHRALSALEPVAESVELKTKEIKEFEWLLSQLKAMKKIFSPYLDYSTIKQL